jgi:predicted nucleotidyltransferase
VLIAARCDRADNDSVFGIETQELVERLAQRLRGRPEVLDAYVFGSVARGESQPHSDVDVAVYVDASDAAASRFDYAAELTADLSSAIGHPRVDLVLLNQAPPLLYHRVLRDGVRVLARNLASTTRREGQALSRYCDYLPHLRKIDALHASRLARGSFGR